jgi:hypothetical protein
MMDDQKITDYILSLCEDFFGSVDSHIHCDDCEHLSRSPGRHYGDTEYKCMKREDGEFCPVVVTRIENILEVNR